LFLVTAYSLSRGDGTWSSPPTDARRCIPLSWPDLSRPSTSSLRPIRKTWMPGIKPGMTDARRCLPDWDRRDKPGDDDCAGRCTLLVMAGLVPAIPLSEALPFVRAWGQVGDEEVTAARASAAGHPCPGPDRCPATAPWESSSAPCLDRPDSRRGTGYMCPPADRPR